jgi:hypothetical protein
MIQYMKIMRRLFKKYTEKRQITPKYLEKLTKYNPKDFLKLSPQIMKFQTMLVSFIFREKIELT